MATACFGLYPSDRNVRIFVLTDFLLDPFFNGISPPNESGDLEGVSLEVLEVLEVSEVQVVLEVRLVDPWAEVLLVPMSVVQAFA